MPLQPHASPDGSTTPGSTMPEVPPYRHPMPPYGPPDPSPPQAAPVPVLPTWYEGVLPPVSPEERLLERRIVLVGGFLDAAGANRATAELLLLGTRGSGPVELHLSCPGADLDAALSLADAVDLAGAPVRAVVRGSLGGPAVAVLCAAAERLAHRSAVLVLSVPHGEGAGTAGELAVQAAQHEHQVGRLRGLVVRATGRAAEEVARDLDAGRVLSGEQALEYGLVSRLV